MAVSIDLTSFFEWVDKLPPPALLCVAIIVMGYAFKRAEWIPNKRIPLLLLTLGGVSYPVLVYGVGRFVLQGVILAFVAWQAHKLFLKPLEEKFPWLKQILCGKKSAANCEDDSNIAAFTKPKDP